MNRTKANPGELAATLFDEVLDPLASTKRKLGTSAYFPLGRDANSTTYFVAPSTTSMKPADFEYPGGGSAPGLIEALVTHWMQDGELELACIGPQLAAIAEAIRTSPVAEDGSVDIFCYTLF